MASLWPPLWQSVGLLVRASHVRTVQSSDPLHSMLLLPTARGACCCNGFLGGVHSTIQVVSPTTTSTKEHGRTARSFVKRMRRVLAANGSLVVEPVPEDGEPHGRARHLELLAGAAHSKAGWCGSHEETHVHYDEHHDDEDEEVEEGGDGNHTKGTGRRRRLWGSGAGDCSVDFNNPHDYYDPSVGQLYAHGTQGLSNTVSALSPLLLAEWLCAFFSLLHTLCSPTSKSLSLQVHDPCSDPRHPPEQRQCSSA